MKSVCSFAKDQKKPDSFLLCISKHKSVFFVPFWLSELNGLDTDAYDEDKDINDINDNDNDVNDYDNDTNDNNHDDGDDNYMMLMLMRMMMQVTTIKMMIVMIMT